MSEPLVDARFRVAGHSAVDIEDAARVSERVADALDGQRHLVVVGDDATLGAVATSYHEQLRGRSERLTIVYLATGNANAVATQIDAAKVTKKSLRRAMTGVSEGSYRRVPTIRVLDTATPTARLGFVVGIGAIAARATDAGRLRRRDLVRQLREPPLNVAIALDWARHEDEVGYLLASALPECWGVAMGEGLTVRLGRSSAELLPSRSHVGTLVERARGVGATSCAAIHIDGSSDYVIDGVVYRSHNPRTIAVAQGPSVLIASV